MRRAQGSCAVTARSACFRANVSSKMSRLTVSVCLPVCLLLLSSSSLQCLASQNPEARERRPLRQAWPAGHDREGIAKRSLASPAHRAAENPHDAATEPSERSLNATATVKETLQSLLGVHSRLGSQSSGVYASTAPGGPGGPNKELDRNGPRETLLAAAATTTPDPSAMGSAQGTATAGTRDRDGGGAGLVSPVNLAGDVLTPAAQDGGRSVGHLGSPPPSTQESVASLPGTVADLQATGPPLPVAQSASSERGPHGGGLLISVGSDMPVTLLPADSAFSSGAENADTRGLWKDLPCTTTAVAAVLPQTDSWDDTKLDPAGLAGAAWPVGVDQHQTVAGFSLPVGREEDEDDVKRVVPLGRGAPAGKGGKGGEAWSGQALVQGEEPGTPPTGLNPTRAMNPSMEAEAPAEGVVGKASPGVTSHLGWFPETRTTTDVTKSGVFQTPRSPLRAGFTQRPVAPSHEISAATAGGLTPEPATEREMAAEEERESATPVPRVSSVSQLLRNPEGPLGITASPPAAYLYTANPPDVEGPVTPLEKSEGPSVTEAPTTPAESGMRAEGVLGTTEAVAAPPSLASSTRRTAMPAAHPVTTAATYEMDRLESEEEEEGEEEEEEEEEEPDDDDEEEEEDNDDEDDDDRDPDSMDDSLEGDASLSSYTVPGQPLRESLGGAESAAVELSGASYQMPSAIEWEHQNQGLVRSWMETLKDKAGYMSGMLVPVGVGIAGALFILGALYSIKIMNRRRRNGFKRHKRKREFNSMQDRVMLLADSSEDEF